MGAGSSTLIGQTLENISNGKKRSITQIAENTIIDTVIGAAASKVVSIKVPGITAGRNSMEAVYKSGLTKLTNRTASKMSAKVICKGITSGITSDLGLAAGMGVKSFLESSWEQYYQQQKPAPTRPYYLVCAIKKVFWNEYWHNFISNFYSCLCDGRPVRNSKV